MYKLTKLLIASLLLCSAHKCGCNNHADAPYIQRIKEGQSIGRDKLREVEAESKRKQAEFEQKLAMEAVKKKEKRRLAKKAKKEEEKKEREEGLEKLVERRMAVERGEKRLNKRGYFIASSSGSYLRRIKGYINELQEELAISDEISGLTQPQQVYVRAVLKRIDWLSLKLKSNIEDIQYFIAHPDPSVDYTTKELEAATQLLQDVERQKEDLHQLLSTKGEDLTDY